MGGRNLVSQEENPDRGAGMSRRAETTTQSPCVKGVNGGRGVKNPPLGGDLRENGKPGEERDPETGGEEKGTKGPEGSEEPKRGSA